MTSIYRFLSVSIFVAALSACGGGGGSPGSAGGTGSGGTSGSGSGSGGGTGTITTATVVTTLLDSSGSSIHLLTGGQTAKVRAVFTDSKGVAIANAVVKYTASDTSLVTFTPSSASALTDSNGVATVTVAPFSFTTAGALTITAAASSGALSAGGDVSFSIGAAPIVVGALSFNPAVSGSLPAFSTATLNIPLTSNGLPITNLNGAVPTLASDCIIQNAATLVQGQLVNGILSATYTNKGCTLVTDHITVTLGGSSQSTTIGVDSANIGTIQFVGTDSAGSALVLKGSGGVGRKESAVVTFKIVDQNNVGLAGVSVTFVATTTTGGLTVSPNNATSDADGNVSTTVASGTIPTPVKVLATAMRNGKTISGLSDYLTISTGLPIQKAFSLSVATVNIEGWDYDNETTDVNILLADQYGNPVSDNTTVNFVAEGGAIGSSDKGACVTTNGGCSVVFKSQAFRPSNGRVTVMAYAQGVENFVDTNGDGQYSCTAPQDSNGNPVSQSAYRPLVDTCPTGSGEPFTDLGDAFLDAGILAPTTGTTPTGTFDGTYTAANGDLPFPYNHTTYTSAGDGHWGINYIRASAEIVLSGSSAILVRQNCSSGTCVDWTVADGNQYIIQGLAGPGCSDQFLAFRLTDVNNNPMPAKTIVATTDSLNVTAGPLSEKIATTNRVGGTFHFVSIKADAACKRGTFTVTATTPKLNLTPFYFSSN